MRTLGLATAVLITALALAHFAGGHAYELRPTKTEALFCMTPDGPQHVNCAHAPNTPPPEPFCDDAGIDLIRLDTISRPTDEGVGGRKLISLMGPTSFTAYKTAAEGQGSTEFRAADGVPRFLPPGAYRFRAKHLGSQASVIDPTGNDGHTVTYDYPPSESAVRFEVKPCGALHGLVRDQDGEGIGDVTITAVGAGRRYTARTDRFGFYVIPEMRRGQYTVKPTTDEDEEFEPARRTVTVTRRGSEANFRAVRPTVSGRLTERSCGPDACSAPRAVPEVAVIARSVRTGKKKETVTDDDGSYKLKLERGRYEVFPADDEHEYDPPVRAIDLRRNVTDANFERCGDEGEASARAGLNASASANEKQRCPIYLEVSMRMWVPHFGFTDPALLTNAARTRYDHRAFALLGDKTALWPPCPGQPTGSLESDLAPHFTDLGDIWTHAWYRGAGTEQSPAASFEAGNARPLVNYRFVVRFDGRRTSFLGGAYTHLRRPQISKHFGYKNTRSNVRGDCSEARPLPLDLEKTITDNGISFRVAFNTRFPFRPFENVRGHDFDDPILNENRQRRRQRADWLRELRRRQWLSPEDKVDFGLDVWNKTRYPDPQPFKLTGSFLATFVQPPGQLDPSYAGALLKLQWAAGQFPNYGVGLRQWKNPRWVNVPWGNFEHTGLAGQPRKPYVFAQSSETPAWEAEGVVRLGSDLTAAVNGTSEIKHRDQALKP